MVRVDEETGLGVAVATDGNGRFAAPRPVRGRAARAGRGVPQRGGGRRAVRSPSPTASTSARPRTRASCGSSREAVRGLADGCAELGIPVTGGNVSASTTRPATSPIHPTPVIGVLGVHRRRRPPHAVGLADAGPADLPARRDPGRARRLGVGGRRCTATSAACRRRWTWPPRSGWPTSWSRLPRRARRRRARPVRRRARAGARRGLPALRRRRPGLARRAVRPGRRRPVRRPVLGVDRAGRSSPCPRSEEVRFTDMCAARGIPFARIGVVDHGGQGRSRARRPGALHRAARRAARGARAHPAGRPRGLTARELTATVRAASRPGSRSQPDPTCPSWEPCR